MTCSVAHRGGASIAYLEDLDAVATAAVIYLRLWSQGIQGQYKVKQDLTNCLGDERGSNVFESFAHLNEICALHARRPLMHHQLGCKCVGADEACFGHFVATAADGDASDTLLFATLIVRADVAPIIAGLASQFGLALKQMNLSSLTPRRAVYEPTQTLH